MEGKNILDPREWFYLHGHEEKNHKKILISCFIKLVHAMSIVMMLYCTHRLHWWNETRDWNMVRNGKSELLFLFQFYDSSLWPCRFHEHHGIMLEMYCSFQAFPVYVWLLKEEDWIHVQELDQFKRINYALPMEDGEIFLNYLIRRLRNCIRNWSKEEKQKTSC